MSQYGNYTKDLTKPNYMKKLLTVIATILLLPFILSGFLIAIPVTAFVKGFELCKSMIDSGRI